MATGFRRPMGPRPGRSRVAIVMAIVAFAVPAALAAPSAAIAPERAMAPRGAASAVEPASPTLDLATYGGELPTGADDEAGRLDPSAARESANQDPGSSSGLDATAGLQPSIQYEEAERHAADRIAFTPGGRVSVAFQPRPGDHWAVGGVGPAALPAGRLDGAAIRAQAVPRSGGPRLGGTGTAGGKGTTGSTGTDGTSTAPVDLPSGSSSIDALDVSWSDSLGGVAGGVTPTPGAAVSLSGLRREIFGFLPYWELNSSSLRLDYSKISTIAFFGVGADGSGNLQKRNADGSVSVGWSGWTSSKMTSVISAAHSNHTRVVLTVQSFGWNTTGLARQKALLGSSTNRLNLARQIAAAVRDRGADGVNLDFEPLAATYDAEFTALVRSIRTELNRIHSGYQVTFDTTGSIGNYPIADATAPGGADAIFIMGYDYRTASSSPVGSVAPLSAGGYDIRDTVAAYAARVAPSKLILGVPYYGRAWSTATGAVHATNTSGTKTGASASVVYDTAADYLAKYGRHYDSAEAVAWTAYQRQNCTATYGCVTSWRELYVDDATAIAAKYDLVNQYGLRGAGIWALGYDGARPELWAAIQRKFITDTTPPSAGVRTLPGRQLNPGFPVTWGGQDDVAVVSYDVQVSVDGAAWTAWLSATKATSATWYGGDNHGYAFRVRARDPKGNVGAWNVISTGAAVPAKLAVGGFGVVRTDGLSIRSAPDTSAARIGTYSSGDLVAIVGGPRSADGYTWFQVLGPLTAWGPIGPTKPPAWVAATGSGTILVAPVKPPNATRVGAAIGDLAFGNAGPASLGTAAAAAASRAFSPNGDGSRDTLAIDWTNDRVFDSLALRVFRADGALVGSVPLSQLATGARQAGWNGRVGTAALPNGRYLVTLVGKAGGIVYFDPSPVFLGNALAVYGVTIDTVAPVVSSAGISGSVLSPNGDGILDTVTTHLAASGADSWAFSAAPLVGTTVGPAVASRSGVGASAAVAWNGTTNAGARVPDGRYRLTMTASDHAGNRAARSWTVRVDDTAARVTPTATPAAFSPNGDGTADRSRLSWSATEPITGTARIYHGTTLIRSWTITAAMAGAVTWTGTNAAGHLVPDGRYTFRVSGRDAAGNVGTGTAAVVVDRTLAALRWSRSSFFPQDGDALAPSSRLTFSLARSSIVTVGIYQGPTLVRAVWTARSLAAGSHGWTWDGRNAAGVVVPRGLFQVRVTAVSSLGTSVLTQSVLVDAFRTALSATALRAGQTLTITFTTTETLRSAPTVSFTQPGRVAVRRTAVSLGSGRYRVSFTVASGAAGTATIRIAGRDVGGGLNTTARTVTIR